MYMSVYAYRCMSGCLWKTKEDVRCPGVRVTGSELLDLHDGN